ncbi:MAG: phosphate ABC transporter permease subunit PstC, partial [Massilia sp.]
MSARRRQDFLFHRTTGLFAASVLVILAGIIASLTIGAWPALREFGPGFVTRVEWDPVNEQFGAMIAIGGTLAT